MFLEQGWEVIVLILSFSLFLSLLLNYHDVFLSEVSNLNKMLIYLSLYPYVYCESVFNYESQIDWLKWAKELLQGKEI